MVDKIAILGAGAFGLALANAFSLKANEICLWDKDEDACKHINQNHRHPKKFSNIIFPINITARKNIFNAIKNADIIILAVPIAALKEVLPLIANKAPKKAILLNAAKGIDGDGLRLPCDFFRDLLPKNLFLKSCYLSGPSFASEILQGLPFGVSIAGLDDASLKFITNNLCSNNVKLYSSNDIVGVCLGGALKNVMAIALGLCSGFDLGRNAKALLTTLALKEIADLGVAMGAKLETFAGLSGMGDFILSSGDEMSRNFRLGVLLSKGHKAEDAIKIIGSTVEGFDTAKCIPSLCQQYNIHMPIALTVYNIIFANQDIKNILINIFVQK